MHPAVANKIIGINITLARAVVHKEQTQTMLKFITQCLYKCTTHFSIQVWISLALATQCLERHTGPCLQQTISHGKCKCLALE